MDMDVCVWEHSAALCDIDCCDTLPGNMPFFSAAPRQKMNMDAICTLLPPAMREVLDAIMSTYRPAPAFAKDCSSRGRHPHC